jgi:branched-chain amino acid transport system ATP-binding protein
LENPLVDVSGLSVCYGGAQVLHDIAFQVYRGEIFSIIGSNGSGKTTILRTLAGLMRPMSGQAKFDGIRIDMEKPETLVDLGISLVPEGRGLFLGLTVKENLELGAYSKRSRSMASDSLSWVFGLFPKLTALQNQRAGKLSGGEQQMLAIARSLMSRPRLLMLDEPSLGLAPFIIKTLFEIIPQLKAHGMTILLIEQDLHQALKIADRGCIIKNGRIIMKGTGCDLLTDPEIQRAYMGALR